MCPKHFFSKTKNKDFVKLDCERFPHLTIENRNINIHACGPQTTNLYMTITCYKRFMERYSRQLMSSNTQIHVETSRSCLTSKQKLKA